MAAANLADLLARKAGSSGLAEELRAWIGARMLRALRKLADAASARFDVGLDTAVRADRVQGFLREISDGPEPPPEHRRAVRRYLGRRRYTPEDPGHRQLAWALVTTPDRDPDWLLRATLRLVATGGGLVGSAWLLQAAEQSNGQSMNQPSLTDTFNQPFLAELQEKQPSLAAALAPPAALLWLLVTYAAHASGRGPLRTFMDRDPRDAADVAGALRPSGGGHGWLAGHLLLHAGLAGLKWEQFKTVVKHIADAVLSEGSVDPPYGSQFYSMTTS